MYDALVVYWPALLPLGAAAVWMLGLYLMGRTYYPRRERRQAARMNAELAEIREDRLRHGEGDLTRDDFDDMCERADEFLEPTALPIRAFEVLMLLYHWPLLLPFILLAGLRNGRDLPSAFRFIPAIGAAYSAIVALAIFAAT